MSGIKRKAKYLIVAVLICAVGLGFTSCVGINKKPFKDYTTSSVNGIGIVYGTKIYYLHDDELKDAISLLNNLTILEKADIPNGCDFWELLIYNEDGSCTLLDLPSPYIIIDGHCYEAESESCSAAIDFFEEIVARELK